MDEVCRVTILLQDSSEVVNFLLKVVPCANDLSGPVVEASHHTSYYVAGMSEDIRWVCRKFNIRVVFKSGRTLRSMLTKVKDTLPLGKQSNVVYRIPCSCGQVYIGETNGDWRQG